LIAIASVDMKDAKKKKRIYVNMKIKLKKYQTVKKKE
jgi:hypothetical protein